MTFVHGFDCTCVVIQIDDLSMMSKQIRLAARFNIKGAKCFMFCLRLSLDNLRMPFRSGGRLDLLLPAPNRCAEEYFKFF